MAHDILKGFLVKFMMTNKARITIYFIDFLYFSIVIEFKWNLFNIHSFVYLIENVIHVNHVLIVHKYNIKCIRI